jgi:hypothetical protein
MRNATTSGFAGARAWEGRVCFNVRVAPKRGAAGGQGDVRCMCVRVCWENGLTSANNACYAACGNKCSQKQNLAAEFGSIRPQGLRTRARPAALRASRSAARALPRIHRPSRPLRTTTRCWASPAHGCRMPPCTAPWTPAARSGCDTCMRQRRHWCWLRYLHWTTSGMFLALRHRPSPVHLPVKFPVMSPPLPGRAM